jgi:hypothetical protein
LFEQLDADSLFRYSDATLLNFYNNQAGETKEAILNATQAIANMQGAWEVDGLQMYNEAIAKNNLISNGSDWEMNEKYVNEVQIKLNYYGTEAIAEQDKELIASIAEQCPFVGGLCVYRARALQLGWDPISLYDDRALCMNVANKSADNSEVYLDSLYSSQLSNLASGGQVKLKDGEVAVYPNPASHEISVAYHCVSEGVFVLYNNIGQEVYRAQLPAGKTKITMLLPDVPQGLYNYKCKFSDCADYVGKLSIIK